MIRKKEKNKYLLKKTCICLAVWRTLRLLRFSFSRKGAKIAKTAKKAKNLKKVISDLYLKFINLVYS